MFWTFFYQLVISMLTMLSLVFEEHIWQRKTTSNKIYTQVIGPVDIIHKLSLPSKIVTAILCTRDVSC